MLIVGVQTGCQRGATMGTDNATTCDHDERSHYPLSDPTADGFGCTECDAADDTAIDWLMAVRRYGLDAANAMFA